MREWLVEPVVLSALPGSGDVVGAQHHEDALWCEQHAPERRSEEKGGTREAVLDEDVAW